MGGAGGGGHEMHHGGVEDFRTKVWSMTGGPYCRPKHWKRNTAIAMFGIFLVCIPIAIKSAELEQRPHYPPFTTLAGTLPYMVPEYRDYGKPSKESDMYSFGIVALEIACARRLVDPREEPSRVRLVDWVWELYGRGATLEAADKRVNGDFDEREMECLMVVGL